MNNQKQWIAFFLVVIAALLCRVVISCFAISEERRLVRPDTNTYLTPAYSLANENVDSTTRRPPGLPVLAAVVFKCGGDTRVLAMVLALVGGVTAAAVIKAGMVWGGFRTGIVAGTLYAFNITAIGNAPLLLSDTLAGAFAALQFWFFLEFWKNKKVWFLMAAAAVAAVGALIRPVNMLLILPLAVLVLCDGNFSFRRRCLFAAGAAGIFFALIVPWMSFNAARGAGFCIDTNTGAMYHQNGAMILGEVSGRGYEAEKQRILREQEKLFAENKELFPDEASREKWRVARYREVVMKHLPIFLKQQINWQILLPDAPSFLESLGVTSSDRGTMAVLKEKGLLPAIRHYFGAAWLTVIALLLPLLVIYGVTLAAAAGKVGYALYRIRHCWYEIIIFLAFVEYYLFLPGAITAPRYQLPALPCLCVLAAQVLNNIFSKKNRSGDAVTENISETA